MSNLLEKASILLTPTAYDDGKILSVKPEEVLGEEKIVNGTFDENVNGWVTNNANASFVWQINKTALFTSTSFAYVKVSPTLNLNAAVYKVSFDVLSFEGTLSNVHIGLGTSGNTITTTGSYTYFYTSTGGSTEFQIRPNSGGTGSITIDNVSVKEDISGDFDFTRNSSATRVNSQGLIEDMQILSGNLVSNGDFSQEGSEQITNGDFSNGSTGWSVVGLATISNSVASFVDNGTNSNAYINQNVFTVGKFYKVTFDITRYVAGRIQLQVNSLYSVDISGGVGTYTTYVKSDNIRLLIKRDGAYANYDFDIDNVSVKEVGQDWTVTNDDANNYVEFNQDEGTVRLKFLNTSPLTTLTSDTQYSGGKKYKLTVDVKEAVSGGIKIDAAGVSQTYNSAGIQEAIIEPTGGANISFYRATADVDITLNSVSLIEITEDTNLPRIDYTGGVGSWLFEPQSTNLIPYSEDFTQWNKSNASLINTISSTVVSPDGVSYANKLYPIGSATSSFIIQGGSGNCFSVFVKKGERRWVLIYGGFANSNVWFDSENGVFGNIFDNVVTVESFGNDWYKIKILWAQNSSHVRIYNTDSGTSTQSTGNGTDGLYIWGAQLEVQSFATSYIPTNGSTVTRLQDAAFGSGSSDLINSIEGVLYAEIAALANDLTNKQISLNNGTTDDRIQLYYSTSSNQISVFYKSQSGATSFILNHTLSDITQFNKVAFKWKQNDFALWSNGVEVATQTSGVTSSADTLTKLDFLQFNGSADFFGKTKCVAVFKEALTDAELTCLTTI
jgi:hypothetical protein